jgi:hypothetical protein
MRDGNNNYNKVYFIAELLMMVKMLTVFLWVVKVFTLKTEMTQSSEMSVTTKITWLQNQEDHK